MEDTVEDSAGAEIAFDEKAARMIDAAVGFSGQRVQIAPKQPRDDGITRQGRQAPSGLNSPSSPLLKKARVPTSNSQLDAFQIDEALLCAVKKPRRSGGGIRAAEAIIEAEPHHVGFEFGALRDQLTGVAVLQLRRGGAAEVEMKIFGLHAPIVADRVFDTAAGRIAEPPCSELGGLE